MKWLALSLLATSLTPAQPQRSVFIANTNLQSVAVRVTDRRGHDVHGLRASNFTLLENGQPQRIAFFGSENEPISLAILLDTSWSMRSGQKLDRARKLLDPLLRGNLPDDEIFLIPFTDRVGPFLALTPDQKLHTPTIVEPSAESGSALYDTIATALCNMRTARNIRQAIVVITDGVDEHSRLLLDQLIRLAQSSTPQIFMIGFFDSREYDLCKANGKTVTLVSGRAIDNPLRAFHRIAKETGAESFFPSNERDLGRVIDHIRNVLQSEYTLAYYPQSISKPLQINVTVNRRDLVVNGRGSDSHALNGTPVHFTVNSCMVSPKEHPYPWESHVTRELGRRLVYRDDFSDVHSGWPNRPSSRYTRHGYEIAVGAPPPNTPHPTISTGTIAAYGPVFRNFRASVSVSGKWTRLHSPWREDWRSVTTAPVSAGATDGGAGMVFRLNTSGCYMLLLSGPATNKHLSFKLVKKSWDNVETAIIPWTVVAWQRAISPSLRQQVEQTTITIEDVGQRITIFIDGHRIQNIDDASFTEGQIGMAAFGTGRVFFHDLVVEGRQ